MSEPIVINVARFVGTALKGLSKTESLVTEADSLPRIQHSKFLHLSAPTRKQRDTVSEKLYIRNIFLINSIDNVPNESQVYENLPLSQLD
jgi:hypothetical protein